MCVCVCGGDHDDLSTQNFAAAGLMGHIGNSLYHMVLVLSQSMQVSEQIPQPRT